jgi:hypothetical protein
MEKWVYAFRFVGIGWYIALCIGGGIFGGIWLDSHFGSSIIFTLAGVFLGLVLAALGTYKMIEPLIREQNDTTPGDKH